jgi:hypothetical protein
MFDKLRRQMHERDLDARVRKHGWTATYVGDHRTSPTWAYSIGFDETLGQPEIVLFDVTLEDANWLMAVAHGALKTGRLELKDGAPWAPEDQTIGVWRAIDPTQIDSRDGRLAAAVDRRERRTGKRDGLRAFQLVFADGAQKFPWEGGYDERIRHRQPALYAPAQDYGDAPLSPPERAALRLADERGWAMMLVDGEPLKWAYTVGLTEDAGIPELIAFMPVNYAANILHEAQDYIRRGDLVLADGLRWDAPDLKACWRQVHESQYLGLNVFRLAKLRHERRSGRREALDAYQLFLPDHDGHYPWEPGCHEIMRNMQPLLFEPLSEEQLRRGPLAALMRL